MMCFSVIVMTFKAYGTAVMNSDLCFISQSTVRTAVGRGGQFCWKFTSVSVSQKLSKYNEVWKKLLQKINGAIFLPHSVVFPYQTL